MASYSQKCPTCSADITVSFGSREIGGILYWSSSELCEMCGHALEADSHSIPEGYRELEIAQDGAFSIKLLTNENVTLALRTIRAHSSLTLIDLARQRSEGNDIYFRGTEGEANLISYYLSGDEISHSIIAVD